MDRAPIFQNEKSRLFIPALSGFYDRFAQPFAWVALRVAVGLMLTYQGYGKIMDPMGMIGFVESIGFYPGWLWSPIMAYAQFFGGICIAVGLLTRPMALANTFMLAVTLWYHWANPYGGALLTEAGLQALQAADQTLFTPNGLVRLADGGTRFLTQVQQKAIDASLFWTGAGGIFAAFGGGYLSIDRWLKRQF